MKINWIVEHTIWITDIEFKDMVKMARAFMHEGNKRENAVTKAVADYFAGQDDDIYYALTEAVVRQVEDEVNKRLT